VLALALLTAAPSLSAQSPRHDEAKRKLGDRQEGTVKQGAEIARELNDVPAVELLLDVLALEVGRGLAPGHYRDVVWEALAGITDHYARLRVEEELKDSKSEWVRQWCAELLGIYGERDFGASLKRALKDKADGVRRAAARSLGMIGDPDAVTALGRLVRVKDDVLRANATEALARIDPERYAKGLIDAVRSDKDGGVRCALLAAAVEIAPERAEELATAVLAPRAEDDWRPRMQAVETLGAIRTKTAVDALLAALDDDRPAVSARAREALVASTGQSHLNTETWRRWWTDARETFAFPEGASQKDAGGADRSTATYYGLRLESDHVAFLIDASRAMGEPLTSRSMSKAQAAREELAQVLGALHGRLTFNVFAYNLEVEPFEKFPTELTEKTAAKALAFVEDQRLSGAKDIWKALEAVLADESIDTAYLLSSGEPDTGLYVHYNRVTRHLKDANRFRKLRVHAIAYSDSEWFRKQLEEIALATDGEFRWFE